jgi:hypothetical protein
MQVSILQQVRIFISLPAGVQLSLLDSIRSSGDPALVAELARSCPIAAFDLCKASPQLGMYPLPCFALLARVTIKEHALLVANMLIPMVGVYDF